MRVLKLRSCFTLLVALATSLAVQAADETWQPPRTPNGAPDLQGVWANNSATPLERPDALEGRDQLTDEEVAEFKRRNVEIFNGEGDAAFADDVYKSVLANDEEHESYDPTTGNYNHFWVVDRDFDNRTSLIVDPPDGKKPPLTPEAAEHAEALVAYREAHPADSYTDRLNSDRCITYGVPFVMAGYNGYFQIVQNATHVVITQEMIHESRIIPVDDRPPLDSAIRQWIGDPRGHWEGDTLVVETQNFSPNSSFFESGENLHLTERFTRIAPDTLEWAVTVDDSTTWTKPWTAVVLLTQSEDDIFEYACHEGNYAMEGILAGHRQEEQAANTSGGGNE